MMRAEPIAAADPALRHALLAADLPVADLERPGRRFYRFAEAGETVGFGGLEAYGEAVLLRSVVVAPDFRGTGRGRAITQALIDEARVLGVRDLYLMTTTAEAFFRHLGFARIDRAAAPAAILATEQATTICASAAMLVRSARG
jgi:N-acetylglutamate synthase-like GNAT family acetyltransferase